MDEATAQHGVGIDRGWRIAVGICVAAGLVRLLIAALTPLFPDETYYWEWSRNLAGGYFDHPPLIAWMIRLGTLVAGDTPLGVRLVPVLAGFVGALFLSATARRVFDGRAAALTAAMLAVLPLAAAGLVLATPDAPLLGVSAAAFYAVVRAMQQPAGSRASFRWWCMAGVALGLALTAKYTAVLIPLGVFIALLARRPLRPLLADAGPYAATAIALLIFSPVMVWNARHDWASFAFQLQHGLGAVSGSIMKREAALLVEQLGLVTPILFVLWVIAIVRAARDRSMVRPVLVVTAVVIFAFFTYSATKRRVEPNWPALAYLPAIVLAAGHAGGRAWRRWMRGGIALAGAFTLVAYVNAFTPVLPVPARNDPAARASSWDELARVVARARAPRRTPSSSRTWVAADRYQDASELAFHLPGQPRTFALNLAGRTNQYAYWSSFRDHANRGDAMIYVLDDTEDVHPAAALLAPHFEHMHRGEQVALARDGAVVKVLRVWHFDRWRGTWPR